MSPFEEQLAIIGIFAVPIIGMFLWDVYDAYVQGKRNYEAHQEMHPLASESAPPEG